VVTDDRSMVAVAEDSSGFGAVTDLADHEVAGYEANVGVDGVQLPGACDVTLELDSRCRHRASRIFEQNGAG
jgi:hypothetical protein